MIKMLQRKFVFTAMAAVSILLLVLLGAINLVNIAMVRDETDKTLAMISEAEGDLGRIVVSQGSVPLLSFQIETKDARDKFLSSNFFVVRLNKYGKVIYADVSRTSSVDEASAAELVLEVLNRGKSTGKAGKYRYQISNSPAGNEAVIVFLDASEEILSYLRVLFLSGGIGIVCWFAMLFIVILLSKRAIRPIAENIKKQKQFVTNAGHEIKTPLAIILSNTDALELYNGENKWSRNIREQVERLNGLTQNLLTLARMEEAMDTAAVEMFSLSELLTNSVQAFAQPMKNKNICLQAEIQPNIELCANKEQITQLISILMDNAVKYADKDGKIVVCLHKKDKTTQLGIKNTCEVLPTAPPDKMFDRFYRADEARTQKSGGYGIGLSVAESIVQTNKGEITAKYEEPNWVSFVVSF